MYILHVCQYHSIISNCLHEFCILIALNFLLQRNMNSIAYYLYNRIHWYNYSYNRIHCYNYNYNSHFKTITNIDAIITYTFPAATAAAAVATALLPILISTTIFHHNDIDTTIVTTILSCHPVWNWTKTPGTKTERNSIRCNWASGKKCCPSYVMEQKKQCGKIV